MTFRPQKRDKRATIWRFGPHVQPSEAKPPPNIATKYEMLDTVLLCKKPCAWWSESSMPTKRAGGGGGNKVDPVDVQFNVFLPLV